MSKSFDEKCQEKLKPFEDRLWQIYNEVNLPANSEVKVLIARAIPNCVMESCFGSTARGLCNLVFLCFSVESLKPYREEFRLMLLEVFDIHDKMYLEIE